MHKLTLLEYLFGLTSWQAQFVGMGFITLLFLIVGLIVYRHYKKQGEKAAIPTKKFSLVNLVEVMVEQLDSFTIGIIGERDGRKFSPLIATIFLFILFMNLLGNIPGMPAPTANININFGMSAFVFLVYNYYGFKEHGPGYIKQFMGPVWWLAPLMLVIEIISHLVRPASLAIRLFGNINGDHIAVSIFQNMTYLIIPVIFMGLGLFVAFIQALVFSMLSAVYIQLALSHDH